MFLVYNLVLTLLAPVWVPWMIWRTFQRQEKPDWNQRQGQFGAVLPPRKESKPRVWIHTVSVGEFLAAKPLLKAIGEALPGHERIVSVTTSSGHLTARGAEGEGLYETLVYFPIDVFRFQLAAMQRVQPDAVVIVETELWMNFLYAAKTFDAATILVNGRISDRSFPRSRKLKFFYEALLKDVDQCLMQSETDLERIKELGAKEAKVLGNIKFDQALDGVVVDIDHWRLELGVDPARPTVICGSLRAEEFEDIAPALAKLADSGIQVVIAPRHIERVAELKAALGRPAAQRSAGEKLVDNLLILDTYGELGQVYALADVVVVGGGFAKLGGQNIVQPLAMGKPVIHGPHMQNFRDVAAMAAREGAAVLCENGAELVTAVTSLLADPAIQQQMGKAATQLVKQNAGASRRYAEAIKAAIERRPAKRSGKQ